MSQCWCLPETQCALFERDSLHVVPKGPMVTLLMSNKQSREKEPEPRVPFTQTQSLCAVLSKDRIRRADTSPADGPSETGGELSTAQRGHCRRWRRFCPESQAQSVCPQKRLHKLPCLLWHPLLRALSHPPLLSVPIRFKGSKLTEHNTQHLGKYSGNNTSFLLETKTKEGSPKFYVATNNS